MSLAPDPPRQAGRREGYLSVFTAALRGEPCQVLGHGAFPRRMPVHAWSGPADESDRVVLGHCVGPVLDVGCGPGRMSQHLASLGMPVLGIDLVPEAVTLARRRGATALVRDVFDTVPGEGRWASVLLADGNIGIGGDPVALLGRVHGLLAPDGHAVVDLAPPGTGLARTRLTLECGGARSAPFSWAFVGPESVRDLAAAAGMGVAGIHEHVGRWFAVLSARTASRGARGLAPARGGVPRDTAPGEESAPVGGDMGTRELIGAAGLLARDALLDPGAPWR